jgi:hypothetical protein
MNPMVPFARFMLVAAMIICVAACEGTGTGPDGGSGHTTAAPRASGDNAGQTACAGSRDQFTGLQTSNAGAAYDQVVFYFAGAVPAYSTGYVPATDGQQAGTPAALAGQAYLRIVFHGAGARCRPSRALPRPAAKTPFYQTLLMASPANDAGTDLVYGIGLAGRGGYRAYLGPSELVINFSRVTLPRFPGIWDITSWPGYWRAQYAWASGRQPGMDNADEVVQTWAASGRWNPLPAIEQTGASTFTLTAPGAGTLVGTVSGTCPVAVPGPWVITHVTYATPPPA